MQEQGPDWNFGDILDAVARVVPGDRPALVHGDRAIDWAAFTKRTNNLARALLSAGAAPGDKIVIATDIVAEDRLVDAVQLRTLR